MTIKQFYNWAKRHNVEDCDMVYSYYAYSNDDPSDIRYGIVKKPEICEYPDFLESGNKTKKFVDVNNYKQWEKEARCDSK